jgi:3-oxoacyl-[acyl-carrier-protein] synthase III
MRSDANETVTPKMFLTALCYELGEDEHDLDELTQIDAEVRQTLYEGGLRTYRTTERSVIELASGPVRRTVESLSEEERSGIRRLIFASSSAWDESLHTTAALSSMLQDLAIPDVVPMWASLFWCANFHVALELARLFIQDGEESVLVVCADLCPPARADRLVAPQISINSDAAASFVISTSDGPFRVGRTCIRLDAALGSLDRNEQLVDYMEGVRRGVTATVSDVMGTSLVPDQIARVVPNNYNRWTCRSICKLAGFDESKLYLDNVPRFGHALCADNPINLRDMTDSEGVGEGDRILLLGTGPYQWAASVLEATRAIATEASFAEDARYPVLS